VYDDNGETTKTKHQVKSERRKHDEVKQKTLLSEMPIAERRPPALRFSKKPSPVRVNRRVQFIFESQLLFRYL